MITGKESTDYINAETLWITVHNFSSDPKNFTRIIALSDLVEKYPNTKQGKNAAVEIKNIGYTPETLKAYIDNKRNRTNKEETKSAQIEKFSYDYKPSFSTAIAFAKAISFFGWVIILVSVIILLSIMNETSGNRWMGGFSSLFITPSIIGIVGGILIVLFGQMQRAAAYAAECAGESLAIQKFELRKKLSETLH